MGLATPTEGGPIGLIGALIMVRSRCQLNMDLTKQALGVTAKLAPFVLFIPIGTTVFSFNFNATNGHI